MKNQCNKEIYSSNLLAVILNNVVDIEVTYEYLIFNFNTECQSSMLPKME